jgi:hypothetical protein
MCKVDQAPVPVPDKFYTIVFYVVAVLCGTQEQHEMASQWLETGESALKQRVATQGIGQEWSGEFLHRRQRKLFCVGSTVIIRP